MWNSIKVNCVKWFERISMIVVLTIIGTIGIVYFGQIDIPLMFNYKLISIKEYREDMTARYYEGYQHAYDTAQKAEQERKELERLAELEAIEKERLAELEAIEKEQKAKKKAEEEAIAKKEAEEKAKAALPWYDYKKYF